MTQVPLLPQKACSVVVLALVMVVGTAASVGAATASWDRNIETDIAGYKVSYGTQPGVHTVVSDVGNVTTYQFNPAPGRYYVVVQAYNTGGELSEKSGEVIVDVPLSSPPPALTQQPAPTQPNLPPVLAQPANQTSAANSNVSFALSASDAEGKPLVFSATGLPKGLSIDRTSGVISGRPKGPGTYQVVATVSDGAASASRSFTWTIVNGNGKASTDGSASGTMAASSEGDDLVNEKSVEEAGDPSPVEDYIDVSGDFDGDTKPDLATYRRSSSEWRIWTSGNNFATPMTMVWGSVGDRPVAADFNGDRITDFAVYRPSTGTWHVSLSGTQTPLAMQWGGPEDVPVPLDHDGDGKADLALIRNGGYDILLSSANYLKSVQVR